MNLFTFGNHALSAPRRKYQIYDHAHATPSKRVLEHESKGRAERVARGLACRSRAASETFDRYRRRLSGCRRAAREELDDREGGSGQTRVSADKIYFLSRRFSRLFLHPGVAAGAYCGIRR